jgi:hypothetical protein
VSLEKGWNVCVNAEMGSMGDRKGGHVGRKDMHT